ncbi:lanC-like protein 2 isoform X1 [Dendroctonus ponderosae]|uniref:lanC-like protein 2 isoform X1 n=1 Tax=Dendroctonus ponderosae TaxID=77166 RepID=UPI0020361C3E|nr:lanC-like protein 2 isoform X1 [Dendroctonus ponderosae]XP_048522812.1 lanC-like protein 2 isoform X1 [Dendroctonus ponderosae]XP_048524675.1 lanC-like protein 2 isoform X1 [Dendroctonus ponderosae]XP_048524676.1 lanC-like protein 2 isoform X1 [Dendroctonus ponderosae]
MSASSSVSSSPYHEKYHFKNQYEDYSEDKAKPYIDNNAVSTTNRITAKLAAKWGSMLDELKDWTSTDYSVYTGTAGVGLLFFRKNPNDTRNLRNIRKQYLQLEQLKNKRVTFLCGDCGPLALGAIVSYKLDDQKIYNFCIRKLTAFIKVVKNSSSDLPNEYLYGRAGFLYALLFVNRHVSPAPFSDAAITSIVSAMLHSGEKLAKHLKIEKECPLMFQWHDSQYLGAAHGVSGIIYLLLQARKYLTEAELTNLIKPTISFLSTLRFPTGNFPSSLGPGKQDKYVQWCHGAPGFLYMYCEAYRFQTFGDKHYIYAAEKCADVIWFRGILKKGYSLCHGVAGNAYCFLEMFQTTKDERHLYRAIKFAEYCLDYTKQREECTPDRPMSLYEGISGPMYLLLDIQDPLNAKFPGFTL